MITPGVNGNIIPCVKLGLMVHDLTERMAPYLIVMEGMQLAALRFDHLVTKLSCCAG